jgi:hypothetical protein
METKMTHLDVGYNWGVKYLSHIKKWRPAWKLHDDVEGEWESHYMAKKECERRNAQKKNFFQWVLS